MGTVTKPGFYDGEFKKAGQHASDEAIKVAEGDKKKSTKKPDDK